MAGPEIWASPAERSTQQRGYKAAPAGESNCVVSVTAVAAQFGEAANARGNSLSAPTHWHSVSRVRKAEYMSREAGVRKRLPPRSGSLRNSPTADD